MLATIHHIFQVHLLQKLLISYIYVIKEQGKSILNGGSMTLWEFFIKGGPVMWPLFACSIIALAIIIERLFTLRQSKIVPKELIEELELLIRMGRLNDIEQLLKRSSSPLCPIIMTAIKNAGRRREIIKEYMEEAGATQAYTMERYIDILGIIAAISPLLGFLGTATGILATFKAISTMGNNSSQLLATGISEALITTVVGLAIAIPVYVCYRVLIARSDYLLIDMEMTSARILEYLKGETHEVQAE
jgi:biopolymer transport protein ExbB